MLQQSDEPLTWCGLEYELTFGEEQKWARIPNSVQVQIPIPQIGGIGRTFVARNETVRDLLAKVASDWPLITKTRMNQK